MGVAVLTRFVVHRHVAKMRNALHPLIKYFLHRDSLSTYFIATNYCNPISWLPKLFKLARKYAFSSIKCIIFIKKGHPQQLFEIWTSILQLKLCFITYTRSKSIENQNRQTNHQLEENFLLGDVSWKALTFLILAHCHAAQGSQMVLKAPHH